ncbi:hypothetical protein ACU686_03125 [Yinghuangia aomiensis]
MFASPAHRTGLCRQARRGARDGGTASTSTPGRIRLQHPQRDRQRRRAPAAASTRGSRGRRAGRSPRC